jgi:hypothetical protein
MDLDGLLKRITSKGDVAAAGLGTVLGYLLDLKLAITGLPPGTASVLGATAALSVKNGVEAFSDRIKSRSEQNRAAELRRNELERAAEAVKQLVIDERWMRRIEESKRQFELDHILWTRRLITDEEFQASIKQFTSHYRNLPVHAREEAARATPQQLTSGER